MTTDNEITNHVPESVLYTVETLPQLRSSVAFVENTAAIFREDKEVAPVTLSDDMRYMPWGHSNKLPYKMMSAIDADETMSICQQFNAEICYGSGLEYHTDDCDARTAGAVAAFWKRNCMPSLFLGQCMDVKYFNFCVSLIMLNRERTRIVKVDRLPACYVRFAPKDESGRIPYLLFANWRLTPQLKDIRRIETLDPDCPLWDLQVKLGGEPGYDGRREPRTDACQFAVVSRVPTPDSGYYPVPSYMSLFRGKWYDIKRNIAVAKDAKLRNSAPIKYHIEVSDSYWARKFKSAGITDPVKQKEFVIAEKKRMLDFLTGAENSGKVWFSKYYRTPNGDTQSDVIIHKIDSANKEGGDWETDIQEAINMICFVMRVHSNLVGSVPGKTQTNNSGSDKRELFTIAHALQKPYHQIMMNVHQLIIDFNGWKNVVPCVPFIKLTTLDEHTDAETVKS